MILGLCRRLDRRFHLQLLLLLLFRFRGLNDPFQLPTKIENERRQLKKGQEVMYATILNLGEER